jgi:asparagine synthase (glutamine-hydrolysing)
MWLLAGLVHRDGFKVVLTGEGSDELLGGYDIFKETKVRGFIAANPASASRPLLLARLYPYMLSLRNQSPAYLKAFFYAGTADGNHPFFSHLPRWQLTSRLKMFFSDALKDELQGADVYADLEATLPRDYSRWDSFTRAQYLETAYLLPGYILSSQGDRVAMAHAVEGRFPFLDYRLAEFSAVLTPHLKMKVLNEKYLLKRCASHLVPPSITRRAKQPYRSPDGACFFFSTAPEYVHQMLSPQRLRELAIFNSNAVQKLADKFRQGRAIGTKDNMALTGILSTQLLVEQFLEPRQGRLSNASEPREDKAVHYR